jgi:Methionine synthase II (cobalamin-independent)
MLSSKDRILTTHAGSLSRPANLIALSKSIDVGEAKGNDPAYAQVLTASVADVVKKQRELGVDIPDDGEFGKPVAGSYDYGAWWNYAFARMSGFSPAGSPAAAAHETQHKKSGVADLALTSFANRRDWQKFGEFYLDPESSGSLMGSAARRPVGRPACTGPITYTGHAALQDRHRQPKKGHWPRPVPKKASCARSGPAASPAGSIFITRPRKNSCSPQPTLCTRNTRRLSMQASSCRSTIRAFPTTGT